MSVLLYFEIAMAKDVLQKELLSTSSSDSSVINEYDSDSHLSISA